MSLTQRIMPRPLLMGSILFVGGLTVLVLLMVPSSSAEAPDLINVDAMLGAADDDELVNDLIILAHREDLYIQGLEIRLYADEVQIDSALTDDEGGVGFLNLTDDSYSWNAFQDGEQLDHEGGGIYLNVSFDRGSTGFLYDFNDDDEFDDFFVQVPNGTGDGQSDGYFEIYNETLDLVASGNTDFSAGPYQNVSFTMDLAITNYTFSIWSQQGGQLLQNGSFNTYPAPEDAGSDEWFADLFYGFEDRDQDGNNDWIIVNYDVDTQAPQMAVNVTWVIENSSSVELLNATDPFVVSNGTVELRNLSWLCTAGGDYTVRVLLFDENNTLEDEVSSLVTLDLFSLPPRASFHEPQPGAMVWGVVNLTGNASDPDDDQTLELVEVRYQGGEWTAALPLGDDWALWYYLWDTGSLPEGLYDLQVRAYDGDNHSQPDQLSLEVNHNDPPVVTVDEPTEGAEVRGYLTIKGHALDPDGPANLSLVQLSLDDIGFDQPWLASGTSSWDIVWNSSHTSNGDHTLYIRALDLGGLYSPVVQVNITILPNQAPSIDVLDPAELVRPGDWLVDISWQAQDPEGDELNISLSVEPVGQSELRVTIATALPDSGTFTWNCSGFETGLYRIWGRVTDSFGDHDSDSPTGRVDVPKVVVYFLAPAPGGAIADELYRVRWVVDGYSGSRTTDIFLDNDTDPDNPGAITLANLQRHTTFEWETADLPEGTYYLRLNVTVEVLFLVSVVSGPVEVVHQDQPQRLANLTMTPTELQEGVNVEISLEITNPGSGNQRMNITYVMDNVLLAQHDFFIYSKEMELDYLYWTATPGEHTLQVRVYRWELDEFDQELQVTFVVAGAAPPVQTEEDNSPWPMVIIVALTLLILVAALLITGLIPARDQPTGDENIGTRPPSMATAPTSSTPPRPSMGPSSTLSTSSSRSRPSPHYPEPQPVDTSVEFGDETGATGVEDTEIEFDDEVSMEVEFEEDSLEKTNDGQDDWSGDGADTGTSQETSQETKQGTKETAGSGIEQGTQDEKDEATRAMDDTGVKEQSRGEAKPEPRPRTETEVTREPAENLKAKDQSISKAPPDTDMQSPPANDTHMPNEKVSEAGRDQNTDAPPIPDTEAKNRTPNNLQPDAGTDAATDVNADTVTDENADANADTNSITDADAGADANSTADTTEVAETEKGHAAGPAKEKAPESGS